MSKQNKYPLFYKNGRVELFETTKDLFAINTEEKRFELRTVVFNQDGQIRKLFMYVEV